MLEINFLKNSGLGDVNYLNDQGYVLGVANANEQGAGQVLYQNGQYIFLAEIAEKFGIKSPYFYQLNNNGVIAGKGQIWGEEHAFMMLPMGNQNL